MQAAKYSFNNMESALLGNANNLNVFPWDTPQEPLLRPVTNGSKDYSVENKC